MARAKAKDEDVERCKRCHVKMPTGAMITATEELKFRGPLEPYGLCADCAGEHLFFLMGPKCGRKLGGWEKMAPKDVRAELGRLLEEYLRAGSTTPPPSGAAASASDG